MSSPSSSSRETSSGPSRTDGENQARSERVLQDVANNLAHSIFNGRKRSRPTFHPTVTDTAEAAVDSETPPTTSSYNGYGRIFQRQTSPFIAISTIVVAGIRHETAESDDEEPNDVTSVRAVQCWAVLCSIIPNFREQMLQLAGDPKTRKAVCSQISAGAAAARCDDTASLKTCIIDYILADATASRKLGLERKGKKVDRGFNNPVTAALLCPIKYLPTEETFNQLKTGLLPFTASLLPRFLFPEDQIYNPEDVEEGCFRGHLLLRVAKHILQGPSAALQAPGYHRGRKGVAVLLNLTSATRPLLAYLGIQTHFALTSAANWDRIVGSFDYNEFYWNLMGFLDGPEGEDIITLFNYHVFGQPVIPKNTVVATEESDFDVIKVQRAAKRARLAAASTPISMNSAGSSTATGQGGPTPSAETSARTGTNA